MLPDTSEMSLEARLSLRVWLPPAPGDCWGDPTDEIRCPIPSDPFLYEMPFCVEHQPPFARAMSDLRRGFHDKHAIMLETANDLPVEPAELRDTLLAFLAAIQGDQRILGPVEWGPPFALTVHKFPMDADSISRHISWWIGARTEYEYRQRRLVPDAGGQVTDEYDRIYEREVGRWAEITEGGGV